MSKSGYMTARGFRCLIYRMGLSIWTGDESTDNKTPSESSSMVSCCCLITEEKTEFGWLADSADMPIFYSIYTEGFINVLIPVFFNEAGNSGNSSACALLVESTSIRVKC